MRNKNRWLFLAAAEFKTLNRQMIRMDYFSGLVSLHKTPPTTSPSSNAAKLVLPPMLATKSSPPTIQDIKKKKTAMENQTTSPTDNANKFGPLGIWTSCKWMECMIVSFNDIKEYLLSSLVAAVVRSEINCASSQLQSNSQLITSPTIVNRSLRYRGE